MANALALPRSKRQRISSTLTGYIARQFLVRFFSFYACLCGMIVLVSIVDLLDRVANKAGVGIWRVTEMAFLKLPFLSQEIMPFTILFAGMATFWRLTRSNELVVARSSGVSVWQFILPVVLSALILGILAVTVLNPVASILLARFDQMEARYLSHQGSVLSVKKTGLWLRQADQGGQSVIHAQKVSPSIVTLYDVIIFRFGEEDHFIGRIDATQAQLVDGHWKLTEAMQAVPGQAHQFHDSLMVKTDLTPTKILESFAPPETISFWALPGFIDLMERAGFSGHRHQLQFHKLLSTPLLFVAMILIAATFSMRPQRRGHVAFIILLGVLTGFLLHLLSNFVFAIGLSSRLPIELAGWTPAGVSLMLGVAFLLHLEDG